MGRSFVAWMLVLALCGCEKTVYVPYVVTKTTEPDTVAAGPSSPTGQDRPATRITIGVGSGALDFPGIRRRLLVQAYDQRGYRTYGAEAVVTSSDTTVVAIEQTLVNAQQPEYERPYSELYVTVLEKAPGVAMLRATLGSLSDTVELRVGPEPSPSTAVVADSFSVVEWEHVCASGMCHHWHYAPQLLVHEPTGTAEVSIRAVQLVLPTWSSQWSDYQVLVASEPVRMFCIPKEDPQDAYILEARRDAGSARARPHAPPHAGCHGYMGDRRGDGEHRARRSLPPVGGGLLPIGRWGAGRLDLVT